MNSLELGEARRCRRSALDVSRRHAEDRGVEEDVLAAGEVGVEAGAELEQRGDAGRGAGPGRRSAARMPPMHFSSVDLPEPLWPRSADGLALRAIVEARCRAAPRSPRGRLPRGRGVTSPLLERVVLVDHEPLGHARQADDRRAGARRPRAGSHRRWSSWSCSVSQARWGKTSRWGRRSHPDLSGRR